MGRAEKGSVLVRNFMTPITFWTGWPFLRSPQSYNFTLAVGSGEQLRSVPLASANSLSITFTQDVTAAQGRYLVRLSDAVENAENEALDGEFDNPWSLT